MSTVKFSVIIPCYNEEDAIAETIDEIYQIIADRDDCELIVVNDGSTDDSPKKLEAARSLYASLRVFTHPKNKGYGAALKTGIKKAEGEFIAITDSDSSYPNEKLPEMFNLIEGSDCDMVVGARVADDVVYSNLRKIPKYFLTKYSSWIANYDIPDINSGLRVFSKSVCEKFIHIFPDGFSFTTTITLAMLTNQHEVYYLPIGYKERVGNSKIQPIRDTLRFVQLILRTGMYFAPLRVFLPISLFAFVFAFLSLCYDLVYLHNLTDKTVMMMMFSLNFAMFSLLADMIDKRN